MKFLLVLVAVVACISSAVGMGMPPRRLSDETFDDEMAQMRAEHERYLKAYAKKLDPARAARIRDPREVWWGGEFVRRVCVFPLPCCTSTSRCKSNNTRPHCHRPVLYSRTSHEPGH